MMQAILVQFLIINSLSIQLLKTFQVCPQTFGVQKIHMISDKQVALICRNDVDVNQPVGIYNILSQNKIQLEKNKTQILSSLSMDRLANKLLIGSHNSSIYLYDTVNKKMQNTIKIKQNNIIINGVILIDEYKVLLSIGNNGQICLTNIQTMNSSCFLAHSFEVHAIVYENNIVVTCGGDRACKYWSVKQILNLKITLIKTVLLQRISKVTMIISSPRRVVVGGPQGYQTLPNITSSYVLSQNHLKIAPNNLPLVCGIIVQNWNSLLTVDLMGNLNIYNLMSSQLISKQYLGQKVLSCELINMTNLITGHGKGLARLWQI